MGSSFSALGCARPRMEEEENPTASLPRIRPRRAGDGSRQGHRLGGRARKDSNVSTTELLRSSADDISDVASSADASPRKSAPLTAAVKKRVGAVGEGKERLGFGEGGEKVVEGEMEEEEFPGSPSFRFYFQDPIVEEVIDQQKIEDKSQKDDSVMSLNSSEDSSIKSQNKVKAKRPRSKKKGPNAVHNLLTAGGCYHQDNNHHHHTSLARVTPIE